MHCQMNRRSLPGLVTKGFVSLFLKLISLKLSTPRSPCQACASSFTSSFMGRTAALSSSVLSGFWAESREAHLVAVLAARGSALDFLKEYFAKSQSITNLEACNGLPKYAGLTFCSAVQGRSG